MGRPSIYDRPMTGAERQRRSMARLRQRADAQWIDLRLLENICLDPEIIFSTVLLSAPDTPPALQKALRRALKNLAQVLQAIDQANASN